MKNNKARNVFFKRDLLKALLFMKFVITFLLLTGLQVSAKVFSQNRITLNVKATELKTALLQIEKKTNFRFYHFTCNSPFTDGK